jgi:hypothetical protein
MKGTRRAKEQARGRGGTGDSVACAQANISKDTPLLMADSSSSRAAAGTVSRRAPGRLDSIKQTG